jgi:hypothetical protein
MKKYLRSFSVVLPIAEVLLAAGLILVPALVFFLRLKQAAHGSGHVLIHTGEFQTLVPSEGFLSFAFLRATAAAAKSLTVLNTPASLVEHIVLLLRPPSNGTWYSASGCYPAWLGLWPGRSLTYPIYALPAWFYVGRGLDGLLAHERVGTANMVLSVVLAGVAIAICGGLRFGLSPWERRDQVSWFIEGFALWACLFAIPLVEWFRQKVARKSS